MRNFRFYKPIMFFFGIFFLNPVLVFSNPPNNNTNPEVMTMQTYIPAPSAYFQDARVNRLLDVTNPNSNATIKTDKIKYTYHQYPLSQNGECTPEEEFDTVLAGTALSANLHICWKYIENIPGIAGQPPTQVITYRWTPAPFSNWAYNPDENTMYTMPINNSFDFYPSMGIGTGPNIRPLPANLELKNTNLNTNFTSILMSSHRDNHVWGILADYPEIDNPSTPAVDESKSEFKIIRADAPASSAAYNDPKEVFEINYNGYFGFNSEDPRGLYSFDKLSTNGNDSMLLTGLNIDMEYIPPTSTAFPSADLWRISNSSPFDPLSPTRPLNDTLTFNALNNSVESNVLTLWQNKDVDFDTRVGLGTPFPQASLHLAGFGLRSFYIHNGTANQDIARISFRSGVSGGNLSGVEKSFFYINQDGKIGLNNSTPTEAFSVTGQLTLDKSSIIDYAVGSQPYVVAGQNTGIRIVSGRINVNGVNITTSGVGFLVNRINQGRYRIRFNPSLTGGSNQNVFCVANLATNFPYFISTQTLNGPQIDVFIIDGAGNPQDASFNFIVTGPR